MKLEISDNPIDELLHLYNNYRDCNDFSGLKCPYCKNKCLKFHKTYTRNLVYYYNGKMFDTKIEIIVCICTNCKKLNNKQKYHAILPEFILPYMIYEASTIIKSINDYIKKEKLKEILEKLKIEHKLFYDWLHKFDKYVFPSSIVLSINNKIDDVINGIIENKDNFLMRFYQNYNHPFFLFKLTCVPLCITP